MSLMAKTDLDKIQEHFGARMRTLRERAGYTLREMGPLVGVGFSTIHRLESGRAFVSAEMLSRLSRFFRVSPSYFFEGSKAEAPELRDMPVAPPREITLTQALGVVEDRLGISMVIKRRPRPSEDLAHVPPDVLRALALLAPDDETSFGAIRSIAQARSTVAHRGQKGLKPGKRQA